MISVLTVILILFWIMMFAIGLLGSPTFGPKTFDSVKIMVFKYSLVYFSIFGVFWYFCGCSKRDIAENNFVIHEVHCQRNIVLCKQCNEPVPRSDLETHVKDVHAPINCELCGLAVERNNVEQHKVCHRGIFINYFTTVICQFALLVIVRVAIIG